MSYQTSIHFDPTALLIIKNEIDNSIKLVETAVNTLAEEQALPFGIDDALNQFEQCTQVLALIDMPHLSQITQYSAELMRKIMAQPISRNSTGYVCKMYFPASFSCLLVKQDLGVQIVLEAI